MPVAPASAQRVAGAAALRRRRRPCPRRRRRSRTRAARSASARSAPCRRPCRASRVVTSPPGTPSSAAPTSATSSEQRERERGGARPPESSRHPTRYHGRHETSLPTAVTPASRSRMLLTERPARPALRRLRRRPLQHPERRPRRRCSLIVVGLAFFQYYTSDKLALARLRREGRQPRGGAGAARHGRAPVRDGRPAEAEGRDHGHARPERVRDRPLAEARGRRA